MQHITLIAGARPNFMKIAPLIHAIQKAEKEGKGSKKQGVLGKVLKETSNHMKNSYARSDA